MADKKDHGPDCKCGCNDTEEVEKFVLEFDDGEDVEVEPLGIFELDGKEYAALAPTDESQDDVYLYEYKEGEDGFELIDIESDEEFDKVVAEFERILDDYENLTE